MPIDCKRAFIWLFLTLIAYGQEPVAILNAEDSRDNKTYKAVKIGDQIWMAKNLDYNANGSKCYDNSPAYCDKYGRLYNWATAKTACPKGWHLPSKAEWEVLMTSVGGEKTEGKFLKATNGWNIYQGKLGNGTDAYDFSALPGGYGFLGGGFRGISYGGLWWSASEGSNHSAYGRVMGYGSDDAIWRNFDTSYLFSVRCLQD